MNNPDLIDAYGPPWHAKAACNHSPSRDFWPEGHHPDHWFPDAPGGSRREQVAQRAIAVCNTCPVRLQCLADAIENNEKFGVRGGIDLEARARQIDGANDAA